MHTSSGAINFISDSHPSRYNFETLEGMLRGVSEYRPTKSKRARWLVSSSQSFSRASRRDTTHPPRDHRRDVMRGSRRGDLLAPASRSRISGVMETAQKSNRQCDNPRYCSQTSAPFAQALMLTRTPRHPHSRPLTFHSPPCASR